MKEIFAQEGTPWNYPKRYSFNDNLIELRNNMEIGMGGPLMGCLFINGTEASLLNGKKNVPLCIWGANYINRQIHLYTFV